VVQGLKLHIS
jgi:hypothetical protein